MAAAKDKSKGHEEEHEEPVVRDKRRIDPETGEARKQAKADSKPASEPEPKPEPVVEGETLTDEDIQKLLDLSEEPKVDSGNSEHLDDLKRIQAEYANYRKRVERDRLLSHELAIAEVFSSFLPVLDDLDLADAHGDLAGGPLDLVAQKIRVFAERYGLQKVGEIGDQFDPRIHEAIAQVPTESEEASDRIVEVVHYGYRIGERLLRPAKVAVSISGD